MPDINLLKEIGQTGAFGVIALLLWMMWDERKRIITLVNNHLEHETTSRDEQTKALTQLTEVIRTLQDRFDKTIT